MAPDRATALLESTARADLGPLCRAPFYGPAEVLTQLQAGELDTGMRGARQCLAEGCDDRELLRKLRENPFLRAATAPPYGYEGDPTVIDFALGLAPLPADTTPVGLAMYRWMAVHSTTFAAFRARHRHLAARLDWVADEHPGAAVVGVFAGHARELSASLAWREWRIAVQLVEFDSRVRERSVRDNADWGRMSTRPGTLADILAGRLPLTDCALIYAPSVADYLPDNTLVQLLESLVPALRPYGEIVIPAFTRLPEPGLLEIAAEWAPNTRSLNRLQNLARGVEEVTALVHEEPALGTAYLHVQRRPRGATTQGRIFTGSATAP